MGTWHPNKTIEDNVIRWHISNERSIADIWKNLKLKRMKKWDELNSILKEISGNDKIVADELFVEKFIWEIFSRLNITHENKYNVLCNIIEFLLNLWIYLTKSTIRFIFKELEERWLKISFVKILLINLELKEKEEKNSEILKKTKTPTICERFLNWEPFQIIIEKNVISLESKIHTYFNWVTGKSPDVDISELTEKKIKLKKGHVESKRNDLENEKTKRIISTTADKIDRLINLNKFDIALKMAEWLKIDFPNNTEVFSILRKIRNLTKKTISQDSSNHWLEDLNKVISKTFKISKNDAKLLIENGKIIVIDIDAFYLELFDPTNYIMETTFNNKSVKNVLKSIKENQ